MSFHVPNEYRDRAHRRLGSNDDSGNNGLFLIPAKTPKRPLLLRAIASDGRGWESLGYALPAWEHVSVSTRVRCPTWEEMCFVKYLFWDQEDVVVQLHPPRSEWVNNHPFCLHLWRPIGIVLPRPPALTVGI
jgi:hypothetical protein